MTDLGDRMKANSEISPKNSQRRRRTVRRDLSQGGEFAGQWVWAILTGDIDEHGACVWVDWKLFEIEAVVDEVPDEPDGDPVASGYLKWDGCAQTNMNVHTCSRRQFESLGELLAKVAAIAQEEFGVPRAGEGDW